MSDVRSDLVAVLPALDCAATVGPLVERLRQHLGHVVVVSDGSADATAANARAAGAEVEELLVNRGKGYALRRGLALALAHAPAAIVFVDADGQHDPEDVPALVGAWAGGRYDLVIGCRLAAVEAIPPVRYWTNFIGTRILSWMTGVELLDSQSGFRLLDARFARRLPLISDGYAVESEMLIRAAHRGARIGHVAVRTIYNDAGSHYQPLRDTVRISCASIYFTVFDDA